ncbi:MAG: hypothetical protein IJM58_06735 [Muribaculaceae bacterium]|nr:hypothetical protein [Muribaculaceae bacterium]
MDYELDEMRQQMAILKDKLENQTIVNDRFIRRSIKRGVNTINRRYLVIGIIALAMIPYGYWAFVMIGGLSVALWLASCLMMLIVVGFMIYNSRDMRDNALMNGNLLDVKRKVTQAQKRDANWLWFGIPMALAWGAWAVYEMSQKMGDNEYIVPCCIVGVLVGALIGLKVHFKTQSRFNEIIEQIEDLQDTK